MEDLTKSSEAQASQSSDQIIDLVMGLYDSREVMPMQAEENKDDQQRARKES